jgi:hypothetical protein
VSDPCSMCIYEHTGTTGTTGYSVPQTYPGDPSPERTIRLRVESAESGVICVLSCSVQLYSCTRHLALVLACCCSWNDAPLQLSTKDNVIYDAPMSSAPRTLNA